MRKKHLISVLIFMLGFLFPSLALAAGGIFVSGGGAKSVGQTFSVTVSASGATFDSLQGTISVSGPVDVVSISPGGLTWLPGKSPAVGKQFVGITSATDKATVATLKLRAKSTGSGSVSVSGVKLAQAGAVTGTAGGSTSFTIQKAPEPPSRVNVTSSSHPDQNSSYESTTINLSWSRGSNVKGFSFLLDQNPETTPAAKVSSTETSVTYSDKTPGTYYFHIRAQNDDGWSGTTHFKINIKEPEAKVDESLAKPSQIKVSKGPNYVNDVQNGTVTGVVISGTVPAGYKANVILDPAPTLPEGKSLSADADSSGNWELVLDFPIRSGFYKLVVQGQKEKILTPKSDELRFEIVMANGGSINILTDQDGQAKVAQETVSSLENSEVKGSQENKRTYLYVGSALVVLLILTVLVIFYRGRKPKRLPSKI